MKTGRCHHYGFIFFVVTVALLGKLFCEKVDGSFPK